MKRIIVVLIIASAAPFAFVFGNEPGEIPGTDLAVLLCALAGIVLLQSAALLIVDKLLRAVATDGLRFPVTRLLGSLFIASNAYAMGFTTYDASVAVQAVIAFAWGLVMFLVLQIRRWQPFALFVMSTYFVMSLGLYGFARITTDVNAYTIENPPTVNSRRNVYLIGNESLQSPAAYRELYGVRRLSHVDYLRGRGFRVLDRAYSPDRQTLPSYSRMLEFSREVDEEDIDNRLVFQSRNSTFQTFAESGFKIQFLYKSPYFRVDPRVVDFSHPSLTFFNCGFVPKYFFYGMCQPAIRLRINKYIFGIPPTLNLELVERRLVSAARSNQPWLTIYHHAVPFHSELSLNYTDQEAVRAFRRRALRALARVRERGMDRIVETIQTHDPDAVIILFGDHGAAMMRGADLDEANELYSPRQILEDRFGIMLAIYPSNFCTNRIFEGSTTTNLVENVIHCLNGDDTPTAEELAGSRTFYWDGEPRDVMRYARAIPSAIQPPATP